MQLGNIISSQKNCFKYFSPNLIIMHCIHQRGIASSHCMNKSKGVKVMLSTTVWNLGIILDPELNLDAHVKRTTSTCFYQLRQLKTIRRSLSRDAAEMLVHAFVTSRLDYCNSLLAGASKYVMIRLQLVFNAAARLMTNARRRDHITPVLRNLHWLRLPERVIIM